MGGKLTKGIEWVETMFDSILWASVAWMFHFDQLWPTRKLKDRESGEHILVVSFPRI